MAGVITVTRLASSGNYNVTGITAGIANPYTSLALAKTAVEATTGALTWASQITSSYDERVSAFYESGILPAHVDLPGKLLANTFNDGILKRKADDSAWEIVTAVQSNALLTTDPATLTIGSVTDGQFLKRVGATVVGAAAGTGDALTANPLSQFAATTSAELAGVISDETGSGALAFATSPTLVTPVLGVASATSVNKVAITAPAAGATLTIADGATLTASATASVAGTHTGTSSSTNTGDQTITLTGDVTGSGTGSFAATINFLTISNALRKAPFYCEDFLNAAGSNPALGGVWLGAAITSGTWTNIAGTAHHPGIIGLRQAASANSGYQIRTDTSTGPLVFGGGECFEAVFQVTISTNLTLRLGFLDTQSVTEPTDGAWVSVIGTTVSGKTKNNAGPTTTGTTYTLSTATWYRALVVTNSDATLVTFTLYNDSGTSLWTDTCAANIPTAAGREFGCGVIATTSDASAQTLVSLDYMALWNARALTR